MPMALEEPSVVAGVSNAAKIARIKGGFKVSNTGPMMIGQIQAVNVTDTERARHDILSHKDEILKLANEQSPTLVSLGGGAKDLEVRVISSIRGPMVIAELVVDAGDAMGANAVNTMAEAVASTGRGVSPGEGLPQDTLKPLRQATCQGHRGVRQDGARRR